MEGTFIGAPFFVEIPVAKQPIHAFYKLNFLYANFCHFAALYFIISRLQQVRKGTSGKLR